MKFSYLPGERPLKGYTIRKSLGHGGFGEVYQAVSDAGKQVALKLIQRYLDVELRGVGQCLNLKHPHLVTIYDLVTAESGENWIVMEFIEGKTLAESLDEHPAGLPPDEALRWLEGICAGVGQLHEKGFVHRDLKPGNIFLDGELAMVGDYGLSKYITSSRRSGQTHSIGTVHYMAPEIASGRYGREVDVYSLGIMLYEMLTGNVPFDGESPAEILMKHLTAQPDLSRLPIPYRPVVARMLAKRPEDRYASVQAVVADLRSRIADAELTGTVPYTGQESDSQRGHAETGPPAVSAATPSVWGAGWPEGAGQFGAVAQPVPVRSLTSLVPSESTFRRLGTGARMLWSRCGKTLREHPFLASLCVLLTMALMVVPVGLVTFLLTHDPTRPGYRMPPFLIVGWIWLMFSAATAVALCSWGFLWRADSSPESVPGQRKQRPFFAVPSDSTVGGLRAVAGTAAGLLAAGLFGTCVGGAAFAFLLGSDIMDDEPAGLLGLFLGFATFIATGHIFLKAAREPGGLRGLFGTGTVFVVAAAFALAVGILTFGFLHEGLRLDDEPAALFGLFVGLITLIVTGRIFLRAYFRQRG